jgi:hypothetical protein
MLVTNWANANIPHSDVHPPLSVWQHRGFALQVWFISIGSLHPNIWRASPCWLVDANVLPQQLWLEHVSKPKASADSMHDRDHPLLLSQHCGLLLFTHTAFMMVKLEHPPALDVVQQSFGNVVMFPPQLMVLLGVVPGKSSKANPTHWMSHIEVQQTGLSLHTVDWIVKLVHPDVKCTKQQEPT